MMKLQRSSLRGVYGLLALCLLLLISVDIVEPLTVSGQTIPSNICSNRRVLLVVGSLTLEPRDTAVRTHLEQLGYQLDLKTGKGAATADANDKVLVIISESVASDDVSNKFREVTVPVITWEGWLYDNLRMTGTKANQDYGELQPETQIRITDPNHPIATGLTGDVQFLTSASTADERKFHWGKPSGGAAIVAVSRKDNSYAHIFAYEKGANMVGLVAPARRVGFPNGSAQRFTPEGWQLFDAAVTWAISCSLTPPATATAVEPPATATTTGTFVPTILPTSQPTTPATAIPSATATVTPTATKQPPGATPPPTPTLAAAQLSVSKLDFLYTDNDENDQVSAGDVMLYVIKISNSGGKSAYQIRLVDPPDPNSTLLSGTVTTDGGSVVKGNSNGDAHVVIEVPELSSNGRVLISFQARVNEQNSQPTLQNQAITTFVDQTPEPRSQTTIVSDDPDTVEGPDTTVTVLNAPLPQLNQKLFLPILGK